MKILAHVHGYPPTHNAGAEWALHHILTHMVGAGHDCQVITGQGRLGNWEGTLDGVRVRPESTVPNLKHAYLDADLIMTHLDRSRGASVMCRELKKPVVHLIHNPMHLRNHSLRPVDVTLAIMNSVWLAMKLKWGGPQIVVPPPVPPDRYWVDNTAAEHITLLNLSQAKGSDLFWELARRMPERRFLAVRGVYGTESIPATIPPNVTLMENQPDVRTALALTRLLLMPSNHETWGRMAVEAACSGIPTLAHPSDGLLEAMGGVSVFLDRQQPDLWVEEIRRTDDPGWYAELSDRAMARSIALDPVPRLRLLERYLQSLTHTGTKVDGVASMPHFLDHVQPVVSALPPERQGLILCNEASMQRGLGLGAVVQVSRGSDAEMVRMLRSGGVGPVVVSSSKDMGMATAAGRPQFMLEHGAGQTYGIPNQSYAGGPGRHNVIMFLSPNRSVTLANERGWPKVPNAEVGCPKLDRYVKMPQRRRSAKPTVCLTFHWDCTIAPEARSAFRHYRDGFGRWPEALKRLQQQYRLVGHAHPRMIEELAPWYRAFDIPVLWGFDEVVAEADLLCVDNSSVLFEFAALDRPVVVLNCPLYRKDVNHGMRFWQYADIGPQAAGVEDLEAAIETALTETEEQRRRRNEICSEVYLHRDGESANRAAWAIVTYGLMAIKQMEARGMVEMKALTHFAGEDREPNWQHGLVQRGTRFWCRNVERAIMLERAKLAIRISADDPAPRFPQTPQLENRIQFPILQSGPFQVGSPLGPQETKEQPQSYRTPQPSIQSQLSTPSAAPNSPLPQLASPTVAPEGEVGLKNPVAPGPNFPCGADGCDRNYNHPKHRAAHWEKSGHIQTPVVTLQPTSPKVG